MAGVKPKLLILFRASMRGAAASGFVE